MRIDPPEAHSSIAYRADIDGLRGIAVALVVLYHAKIFGISGGFIGVDIFFVISGFLITSIISRELRAGSFSLLRFWERRIRRIMPAFLALTIVTAAAAYFLMLYPEEYHHFGSSLIAQSVFASNFLFALSDNYFSQPSQYAPLLHMWTLSVEEQFYIFLPLLAVVCAWAFASRAREGGMARRLRHIFLPIIALLTLISFALSTYLIDVRPGAALALPFVHGFSPLAFQTAGFYLLPSRAWELGIGAILALIGWRPMSRRVALAISCAGAAFIGYAALAFSDATLFPGLAALAPALGAAAIIVSNESEATAIGRILSFGPLVWLGIISYSLYLWHWPLLVYARMVHPDPLPTTAALGIIVLAVIAAWLSYRYVEMPVRRRVVLKSRSSVYVFGVLSVGVLMALGFSVYRGSIPNAGRIPPLARQTFDELNAATMVSKDSVCFSQSGDDPAMCRIGDPAVAPSFIVWGDSHAEALLPLFDSLAKRYRIQGAVFTVGGCVPVTGLWTLPKSEECSKEQERAEAYIARSNARYIFLVARWNLYVEGGEGGETALRVTDSGSLMQSPADAADALAARLTSEVQGFTAAQRETYIVEQAPEQFRFDPRSVFYRAVFAGEGLPGGVSYGDTASYARLAEHALHGTESGSVMLVDPKTVLCDPKVSCPLANGNVLLYTDENHLSPAGAQLLRPMFEPIFMHIARATPAI